MFYFIKEILSNNCCKCFIGLKQLNLARVPRHLSYSFVVLVGFSKGCYKGNEEVSYNEYGVNPRSIKEPKNAAEDLKNIEGLENTVENNYFK